MISNSIKHHLNLEMMYEWSIVDFFHTIEILNDLNF